MKYTEEAQVSKEYKAEYASSLEAFINKREDEYTKKRDEYTKNIFTDTERYREDFKKCLGWPLTEKPDGLIPDPISTRLSEEDGYTVYRMTFDVLDGIKMTGLYFEMNGGKKPFVIVQHGGGGTPELISGIDGSTYNYNEMLERVISHDVHAFCPQLLLWEDKYGAPYDRKIIDARLKRLGSSVTAVEIWAICRIIDWFDSRDNTSSIGMVGLSYGGMYTLMTTAVCEKIKTAVSCSWFNSRRYHSWVDWSWKDIAEKFDDAEIACLVYPRKLRIQMGDKDNLFDYRVSEESYQKILKLAKRSGVSTDWIEYLTFDGYHEFIRDDRIISDFVKELKEI